MQVYHPSEDEQFRQRNKLLQACLRPEPLPFAIEQEYPIVLAAGGRAFSFCQDHLGKICSHANLWPRKVIDLKGKEICSIGLVGNVATDPDFRGHGHMRNLLGEIEKIASDLDLCALVLWSDLSPFYHKLGYRSLGKEYRILFEKSRRSHPSKDELLHLTNPARDLQPSIIKAMFELRPAVPLTLARDQDEFMRLLSIPWLEVFLLLRDKRPVAYALLGKGYDMAGVVHEWGAGNFEDLSSLLDAVCRALEQDEVLLLAPAKDSPQWFSKYPREEVPMALVKILQPKMEKELEELFVWGLDSI